MKVHTAPKVHAAQTIFETGSTPMQKAAINAAGRDSMLQVSLLVADVLAFNQSKDTTWHTFAWRAIDLPTDARAEFIKQIKAHVAEMRKNCLEAHPDDDAKGVKATVRSATVDVTRLTTIAHAFNAGATAEGLAEFFTKPGETIPDPRNIGFRRLYDYAKTFSASKAGRKADPLLVKLEKWLKNNTPADDATAEDEAVYLAVSHLHQTLVKADAGTQGVAGLF
jgi:hypothetical protein